MHSPRQLFRLLFPAAFHSAEAVHLPAQTLGKWLVFWLVAFLSLTARAQEEVTIFEHIGLEQGLPQGQIIGLLQDSHGYLWFGTMSALIRYDGYNFVQYTHLPADSTSLSHSTAFPKIEDRQGYIWIASHTGLNRWDRRTNRFRRFYQDPKLPQGLPGNEITDVFEDKAGVVWVGTDRGLAWFDGSAFHKIPLLRSGLPGTGARINSIAEDAKETSWQARRMASQALTGQKNKARFERFVAKNQAARRRKSGKFTETGTAIFGRERTSGFF